ncbi:hypothetical protein NDY24_17360 [Xanthomonas hortorum pv. pelargonii]|nr:hypothetical protein NDY24_17360 [Xanthomonas hortorum pv. pelargonii]
MPKRSKLQQKEASGKFPNVYRTEEKEKQVVEVLAIRPSAIEGRQQFVKKFFAGSGLAYFWLFLHEFLPPLIPSTDCDRLVATQ